MMKLTAAVLCDGANIRDGLLSVLGGGITRVSKPSYPDSLGAEIALLFELDSGREPDHKIDVSCVHMNDEDTVVFAAGGVVTWQDDPDPAPPIRTFPALFPVRDIGIPAAGSYEIRVFVDGVVVGTIGFTADVLTP